MNTYKLIITKVVARVEHGDLSNVVEKVNWGYQATDENGNMADVYGSLELDPPKQSTFIPSEELTNAQVEKWLEEKLNLELLKSELDNRLNNITSPIHVELTIEDSNVEEESVEN